MKHIISSAILTMALTSCSQYALVNSDVYNNADLSDIHTFRIVTPAEGNLPPGMQMVTYYNIAAAIREQLVDRGYTEDPSSPILVNIALTVHRDVAYQAFTTPGVWVTPPPIPPAGPGPQPPVPPQAPQPPVNPNLPDVPQSPEPGLAMPPHGSGSDIQPVRQAPPVPPRVPPFGPEYNGMVPYYMYPPSYYMPGTTQIVPSVYREGVLTMDIVDMQNKTPLYSSSVATILNAGDTQFRNLEGIAQAVKVLFSKFPVPILPQYK